jgi:hypothetical protein
MIKNLFYFIFVFFLGGCTISFEEFPELPRVQDLPKLVVENIADQAPSIGYKNIRPIISADREFLIFGTSFFDQNFFEINQITLVKKGVSGYSFDPVQDFTLFVPLYPGYYCIVYAEPRDGANACSSLAKKEGQTIHLSTETCHQTCHR